MNDLKAWPNKILITGPSITRKEIDYVTKAVTDGWWENAGKYRSEFEHKFADYLGVKYAMCTDSCTGALQLAMMALGIGPGDEVIVPEITWISTAAVVRYVGAKPVFVDIEPDTWGIDPAEVEKKITKRTKAIIPVHLYGHPAEMKRLLAVAKANRLAIVEDAAQAHGAIYNGKRVGSLGDLGAFSFFGAKLMVTGQGGMLVTNIQGLYDRAKFLNHQGSDPHKRFWQLELGFKSQMSDLQAALGVVQLSRIKTLVGKKRQIFKWYYERLGEVAGIQMNTQRPGCFNDYWMTTMIVDKKFGWRKEMLMAKLLEYNIETRPFFYPLSSMPPFKDDTDVDNSVAYSLSPYGINLPCGMRLTELEVDFVCKVIKKILKVK